MIARPLYPQIDARHGRRLSAWCSALVAGWFGISAAAAQAPEPDGTSSPQPPSAVQPEEPTPAPADTIPPPNPLVGEGPAVPEPPAPASEIPPPASEIPPPADEPVPGQPAPTLAPTPAPAPMATQPPPMLAEPVPAPDGAFPSMKVLGPQADYSGLVPQRNANILGGQLFDVVSDADAEISLVVGRTKVFQFKEEPKRLTIGDPSLIQLTFPPPGGGAGGAATGAGNQPEDAFERKLFTIVAQRIGTTNLTVWDANNNPTTFIVRVTIDCPELEARIRQIFPGADIKVRQVANNIILDGQVADSKTMTEVLNIIDASLRASMLAAPTVAPLQVSSGGASPAPPFRPQIINRVHVPGPRQVMLKVKLAELNRGAIREIGVNWLRTTNNSIMGSIPGNFGGIQGGSSTTMDASFIPRAFGLPGTSGGVSIPGTVTGGTISGINSAFNATASALSSADSQLFGIFNAGQFDLFINALRSNNLATILAEPNIMTLDGQPARFIAGGEFPFPVPQVGGGFGTVITIQFRPFGAILTFIPHILESDVIRLDVEPIFSQLNFGAGTAVAGTTVPGLNQRSARTVVELREGQSLAIAGLVQKTNQAQSTRVPLLGDIPVVGTLFSKTRMETVETELVVVVTPMLVSPIESKDMPPLPGDLSFPEPNDKEFYFLGRTEGRTGNPHRAALQHLDPWNVHRHFTSEANWVVGPHGHSDQ